MISRGRSLSSECGVLRCLAVSCGLILIQEIAIEDGAQDPNTLRRAAADDRERPFRDVPADRVLAEAAFGDGLGDGEFFFTGELAALEEASCGGCRAGFFSEAMLAFGIRQ
jgi:hypothetical protein